MKAIDDEAEREQISTECEMALHIRWKYKDVANTVAIDKILGVVTHVASVIIFFWLRK